MKRIWIIAKLTFTEAVRRRIATASIVLGVAFLVLFSIGFHFITANFLEIQHTNPNAGIYTTQFFNFLHLAAMYAINFLAIATAALLTADTLSGEILTGTIQTLLANPVRRIEIVAGKWLGNAGLLAAYLVLMAGGSSLSIYLQSGFVAPDLLAGLALLYLNSLLIMTVTLGLSSRISALAAGGAIFGLFGLSFIGDWVERFGGLLNNATAVNVGIISSLIMPSQALWDMASTRMTNPLIAALGSTSPFSGVNPSAWMLVYALVYLAGFLAYAVYSFSTRDL